MTCGKRRYRDRIAALIALTNANRSRSGRRNETRPYRCDKCRDWHLTSRAAA